MNQEKIMESLKKLETQLEEQHNIITNLKKTMELEKELYISKINVLENELNLFKNKTNDLHLEKTIVENEELENDNMLVLNKDILYEIFDDFDKNDPYYKEVVKSFSEMYITNPIEQNDEVFKVIDSFEPVNSWVDIFKKSDKWKKAYKWLLPNAMIGAINISVSENNMLKEEIGGIL